MQYFKRTYGSNGDSSALERVGSRDIDITKHRTIFCLPGDWVSSFNKHQEDDRQFREMIGNYSALDMEFKKHANGLLKIVKRILGGREALRDDQAFMVAYPFDITGRVNVNNRASYNRRDPENFFGESAGDFVEENLIKFMAKDPVLKDKYKNTSGGKAELVGRKLTGQKLSLEELSENMCHINLLSFSHGAVFAGEICNCMKKYMRDVGYEEKDIKTALGNVNLLAISSVIQTRKPETMYFRAIHFQSVDDEVIKNILFEFEQDVETKFRSKKLPFVEKLSENSLRVIHNTKSSVFFLTNREKNALRKEIDLKKHQPRLTASYRYKEENTMPVMIENTLRNMFFRDRKIENIQDFLLRENDKVKIPDGYDFREELKIKAPINDRMSIKFMRRVFNKYIEDIIDESLGQGMYKK